MTDGNDTQTECTECGCDLDKNTHAPATHGDVLCDWCWIDRYAAAPPEVRALYRRRYRLPFTPIPDKYREHMSAAAVMMAERSPDEDNTYRMSQGTVKVTPRGYEAPEDRDGCEWWYRGRMIQYDTTDVYNPWQVGLRSTSPRFETLREAKARIDEEEGESS